MINEHINKIAILVFFCLMHSATFAGIPDDFQPIVIEPPFSFSKRVLDLTLAVEESKKQKKLILLYLGAKDCPPCRAYERFLEKNTSEMKPILSNFIVADIRTWLKGPEIIIKLGEVEKPLKQFRLEIGDNRSGLWYPTWWLLDSDLKQAKQIPSGSARFLSVQGHKEVLKLE